MSTREQVIVEIWEGLRQEVAGAAELAMIQEAIAERFGAISVSPAFIARVLADTGARLSHPEILQADSGWRVQQSLFTADDLGFENIESATRLMDKIGSLHDEFVVEPASLERLRQWVRQLKTELDLLAKSENALPDQRELARELAQWLTVWLQNPQIFAQWLDLRRATPEFKQRFP